jgi:hypothetical protein
MNESMNKLLIETGEEILNFIKSSKEFVSDQAPQVAKEYLKQQEILYLYDIIVTSIGIAIVAIIGTLCFSQIDFSKDLKESMMPMRIFYFAIGGVAFVACIITLESLLSNIRNYIELKVAPKVALLNYFTNIFNKE